MSINQLFDDTIPNNCVAVCGVSGDAAVLVSNFGQCLIMAADAESLVREVKHLSRVIIRGERAASTTLSNLHPSVLTELMGCILSSDETSYSGTVVLLDPDSPSPRAIKMLREIPEIERFARMLLRAHAPASKVSLQPAWVEALGVSRAPRAAREALMDAISQYGRQVGNIDLANQTQEVKENLRQRDAAIGQKRA